MIESKEKYEKLKSRLFYVFVFARVGYFTYVNEEKIGRIIVAIGGGDIKNGLGEMAECCGNAIENLLTGLIPLFG